MYTLCFSTIRYSHTEDPVSTSWTAQKQKVVATILLRRSYKNATSFNRDRYENRKHIRIVRQTSINWSYRIQSWRLTADRNLHDRIFRPVVVAALISFVLLIKTVRLKSWIAVRTVPGRFGAVAGRLTTVQSQFRIYSLVWFGLNMKWGLWTV